ncbi:hypothetical protein J3A83DRAFT_2835231 [Scleroderma citrinum]
MNIVLQEVFSVGMYNERGILDNSLCSRIRRGELPPRPTRMPDEWWELCTSCWNLKPSSRPSMSILVKKIEKVGLLMSSLRFCEQYYRCRVITPPLNKIVVYFKSLHSVAIFLRYSLACQGFGKSIFRASTEKFALGGSVRMFGMVSERLKKSKTITPLAAHKTHEIAHCLCKSASKGFADGGGISSNQSRVMYYTHPFLSSRCIPWHTLLNMAKLSFLLIS